MRGGGRGKFKEIRFEVKGGCFDINRVEFFLWGGMNLFFVGVFSL